MAPGYIIAQHPPASGGRCICTEFNPSTGQGDILMSSTGYTYFLIDCSLEGQYVTLVFDTTFPCIWNQMFLRNIQTEELLHDSMIQNPGCFGSIFPPAVLIFPKIFLDFGLDTIKIQGIINLSCKNSYCYDSVVVSDSEVTFFRIRKGCNLLSISLLFCS